MRPSIALAVAAWLLLAAQPAEALREVQHCEGIAPLQATCTLAGFTDVDWVFGVFFDGGGYAGVVTVTIDGTNGGHERWVCNPAGPNTVRCTQVEQGVKALGMVTVRLDAGLSWLPVVGDLPAMVPGAGAWQMYLYLY